MKRWELVVFTEDGRVATCPIPLDFLLHPHLVAATGATMESLIKHRLYDAFVSLEHHILPTGPELPQELKDNPP